VLAVSNGAGILSYLENNELDLIITDMRMPVVDGVNLIKAIRDKNYEMDIIVISGYSDYDLLREVLKLNIQDYLLKPYDLNEFIALINKVISKKQVDIAANAISKNVFEKFDMINFPNKDSLLYYLVKSNEFYDKYCIQNGLDFSDVKQALVGVFVVDAMNTREHENSIYKKVQEILQNEFEISSIRDAGKLISIFMFNDTGSVNPEDEVSVIHKFVNNKLKEVSYDSVSLCCGSVVYNVSELYKSFDQTRTAETESFYMKPGSVAFYDPEFQPCKIKSVHVDSSTRRISKYLEEDKLKEAISVISETFDRFITNKVDPGEVREWAIILYGIVISNSGKSEKSENDFVELISKSAKVSILNEYMINEFRELIIKPGVSIDLFHKTTIEKAIDYIDRNYANEISLKDVSKYVFLNMTYFSEIFKKETGRKFVDYLIDTRINAAKKILLKYPEIEINKVGAMVGYKEVVSFSRAFKKIAGCTPTCYRLKGKNSGNEICE